MEKKITAAQSVMPMLFGLFGVLLLIFTLAALIKKFSAFNLTANHIKVVESQNLGTKEKILIVQVQNKQYLLGVTPHSINRIDTLEEPVVKKTPNLSFDSMMKQFLQPQKKNKTFIKTVTSATEHELPANEVELLSREKQ